MSIRNAVCVKSILIEIIFQLYLTECTKFMQKLFFLNEEQDLHNRYFSKCIPKLPHDLYFDITQSLYPVALG